MAKKAAPKSAPAKAAPAGDKKKAATKSDIYSAISDATKLSKKDVAAVFDAFAEWSRKELGKKGPEVILLPGIAKIKATRKPATKATTKANPFKPGEMMTVKAKPASIKLRIVPLKAYKESL